MLLGFIIFLAIVALALYAVWSQKTKPYDAGGDDHDSDNFGLPDIDYESEED